jgi:hypothetical protein
LILIGKFLLREKMAKHPIAAQSGVLGPVRPSNPSLGRCFAHLLWIRLCASTLSTPQSVDSFTYFAIAQKPGKRPDSANIGVFQASVRRLAQQCEIRFGFCTPSVDKIVCKGAITASSR